MRGSCRQGRILGIDFGTKSVGLAITDEAQIMAYPYKTIGFCSPEEVAEQIAKLGKEQDVRSIVIGLPRRLKGTIGTQAKQVLEFARLLHQVCGLPVIPWDERLSTRQADRLLRCPKLTHRERKRRLHHVSAQIILQSYLDSKR